MEYRELGKTGLKVPVLSFGASSLGGVFHSINEAEAIKAVFTAVENGLNFIDVSPYYGHYKAETVLGKALKELPRDSFVLSTKVWWQKLSTDSTVPSGELSRTHLRFSSCRSVMPTCPTTPFSRSSTSAGKVSPTT